MMLPIALNALALLAGAAIAGDWAPAPAPLMSRFAKDVSPDRVHPEYPRPQMVREDWLNLNGLWDYAVARKEAPPPQGWQGKILVPFPIESALSGVRNEGWGQYDTERLTGWVKQSDPTRLVNSASGGKFFPVGDVIDDHGYWIPTALKQDGRRAVAVGEFGGRALVIPGHVVTERVFGHPGGTCLASPWELTRHYIKLLRHVHEEREKKGLSAAIYTQLSDIEAECNGFVTYDRAVAKMDIGEVAAANRGQLPPPTEFRVLSPLGQQKDAKEPVLWRYTFDKPSDAWLKPDFDDSAWQQAPAGFGKGGWRTQWTTPELWMRREFTLDTEKLKAPELIVHHDKHVEIYLNGVLASRINGYSIEPQEFEIRPEAKATLKPGRNVLAVHASKGDGGQYIDVGLVDPR